MSYSKARPSVQLTIDMKIIFYSDANKTHFHMNGCRFWVLEEEVMGLGENFKA